MVKIERFPITAPVAKPACAARNVVERSVAARHSANALKGRVDEPPNQAHHSIVFRVVSIGMLATILAAPNVTQAAILAWRDTEGVTHLRGHLDNVPSEYRERRIVEGQRAAERQRASALGEGRVGDRPQGVGRDRPVALGQAPGRAAVPRRSSFRVRASKWSPGFPLRSTRGGSARGRADCRHHSHLCSARWDIVRQDPW